MRELYETGDKPKRAFLIGIRDETISETLSASLSDELAGLAKSLGLEIAARETVRVRGNNPKFGVGSGKAAELAEKAALLRADCLVFDQDISPSRQRNWEKLTGISAIDRQELIIRIFSGRATTREAELQVTLAALSYSLPRLSHKYIDLSRQRGGRYGTRGSGETRLETDRRLVMNRIDLLKGELAEVCKQREVRRKKREKAGMPVCALVGYTNAGKSSLLNALTRSDVLVEDKLFATLDATTRICKPAEGPPFLITDTVGFIRRLPHCLVDAFRSTLEELSRAALLLHVLDASDPEAEAYFRTTMTVLRDLGAEGIPMITILNKADLLDSPESAGEPPALSALRRAYPGSIPVSTRDRRGLDELVIRIGTVFSAPASGGPDPEGGPGENAADGGACSRFSFPPDRYDLAALLHRRGRVLSERYDGDSILMEARVEKRVADTLREYLVPEKRSTTDLKLRTTGG
ncbi:MAG: GTPase HflX [Spirochaetaceae bacterium]|nr:GTPase HflX [Spirochaetaceae bacterium]